MGCVGKYLERSGADHVLIETETFGVNVTDQIMRGGHYYRCLTAFSGLSEALQRMQFENFIESAAESISKYEIEKIDLEIFTDTLIEKNYKQMRHMFEKLSKNFSMHEDFQKFIARRRQESELYKYWDNVERLFQLMKDLIRADRTGNWKLHRATPKQILPLFFVFDHQNYARWATIYYQDIIELSAKHPKINEKFEEGFFTVKKSSIPNASVAPDLALEQTANRNKKKEGGVKGKTDDENYVTMWDLTNHEMISVQNLCKEITFLTSSSEYDDHHDLNELSTKKSEQIVKKIKDFICKHTNPFKNVSDPLKNIITQELCPVENKSGLLNVFESGCIRYKEFYEERILHKSLRIDEAIKRFNLPKLSAPSEDNLESKKGKKGKSTDDVAYFKLLELARQRGYNFKTLFTFDLSKKNKLFHVIDGTMVKSNKAIDKGIRKLGLE